MIAFSVVSVRREIQHATEHTPPAACRGCDSADAGQVRSLRRRFQPGHFHSLGLKFFDQTPELFGNGLDRAGGLRTAFSLSAQAAITS